ncbi:MAG TPA: sulfotransferase [Methylothermaceae bacterium]|nr:sulfotransferase [Methylothermaceae bacterium]
MHMSPADVAREAQRILHHFTDKQILSLLANTTVILSAPRSGSTLVFETLRSARGSWSIGGESHIVFGLLPELGAAARGFRTAALNAADAHPLVVRKMRAIFLALMQDRNGKRLVDLASTRRPRPPCFIEKTPRNALNTGFLEKVFPGMKVVYIYRNPRPTISSIMEAWHIGLQSGRFVTVPDLPGWDRRAWCLLLPPGWQQMNGRSIAEIAAFQWKCANESIMDFLDSLPAKRYRVLSYEAFLEEPGTITDDILRFMGLRPDPQLHEKLSRPLPPSSTTVTPPAADKWKRHEQEINHLEAYFAPTERRFTRLAKNG